MPATTCALVTTSPGATTKPEPSWITPHPDPSILTVDGVAAVTAGAMAESLGGVTGGATCGGKPAKTTGNPSDSKNESMREKIVGGDGRSLSVARMMCESATAELSEVKRLLVKIP